MISPRWRTWTRWGLVAAVVLTASALAVDRFLDVHPFFGSNVAFIGDVDGDGTADFVVGDAGHGLRNSVTIVSGRGGRVIARLGGGTGDRGFSDAIAAVGDLDGDAAPDFAVGARLTHPGGGEAGANLFAGEVWLVSGRRGRVLRVIDGRTLVDDDSTADGRAGSALAGAGDLDGDGIPDVAIGLPEAGGSTGFGRARGLVVVVSGRDGRVLRRLEPSGDDREFGHAVAGGLDLDRDGIPDLVVGIPGGRRRSHTGDGRVRLISGKDGHCAWAAEGTGAGSRDGERMGEMVGLIPDLDGDGTPDVLSAGSGSDGGRILALSGRDGRQVREWTTPPEHRGFSGALEALPDQDGDGVPEIVYARWIGSGSRGPGASDVVVIPDSGATNASEVVVLSSRTGNPLWRFEGTARSQVSTLRVAVGGDLDGDGTADVVVGELGIHGSTATSGRVHALSGKDGHTLYVVSGGRR